MVGGGMGHRIFRDARGTEWQTWDVVPHLEERRVSERRAASEQPQTSDRRMRIDRRVLAGIRPALTSGLSGGWLCFEADDKEKRRLTPIPDDWQQCASEQLEQYCARAMPARRDTSAVRIVRLND